jgi:type I restriction enzyme S subunit
MSFPRYPSYKDSGVEWLREVPAHWEVVQFKQLVDIQNGSDHKHVEAADGYPVLGSGGIFTYASDFLYDGESVLLGRKGTIDKPLHITGRFWTVDTMYWTKINPGTSGRFIYYSALTIPFDYYSTNTALPSMTKGALSSHLVVRPPLLEQAQIADFLDHETAKIDELVAEQRRLMELLKEKRQAVISHAVTKGLNPDVPMKPSGIEWLGDVPAHWDVNHVRRYLNKSLSNGIFKKKEEFGQGALLVNVFDIYRDNFLIDYPSLDRILCSREEQAGYEVLADDAFFVRSSLKREGIAAVAVAGKIDEAVVFECHLIQARFDPQRFLGRFARYLFNSMEYRAHMVRSAKVTTMTTIDQEAIASTPILVPPLKEQTAIAAFLDRETSKIDGLVSEAQRAIDLLQERRTALISAAVTGQIDVCGLAPQQERSHLEMVER